MIEQKKIKDIPILDFELLKTREDIAETFLPKLIKAFDLEVQKLIRLVQKSYEASNIETVKELGHKLKGMCLNMGAMQLSEIGRKIEEEEGELIVLLSEMKTVSEETRRQLNQMI